MVVARKGKRTIKVSKRAYETLFRDKGYVLDNESENVKNVETEYFEEEPEVEEEVEEVETIPISDMNKEQLAEYAKEYNIDTSSAKNVREARQIIQKAIRESKM